MTEAVCLMNNCRNRAPAYEAFCAKHREGKNMTAPHIERMKDELAQLADRKNKLRAFIDASPIFRQLPSDERGLMIEQHAFMDAYHDTLETRIVMAEKAQ